MDRENGMHGEMRNVLHNFYWNARKEKTRDV
jgi:hypothetical protein